MIARNVTSRGRRGLVAVAAAAVMGLGVISSSAPAQAMGTGNPYEDMQVGVTYTVYQPSYTVGLKTPKRGSQAAECPPGTEENLRVEYGTKNGLQFSVNEGNPMCADIGSGATVMTVMIRGAKASVVAYCDPGSGFTCTRADVKKQGGHLSVVMPAASNLRKTTVWIETAGTKNLSARQLVRIARSLHPVQ